MLTTLQKPKTTPAAGIKRKASQMTDDAAGPAAPPPLVASGPSAEAPSASPRTPWGGLPKPKGKPQRQHYHSELAYQEALAEFNDADISWIKKEQATEWCKNDADTLVELKAEADAEATATQNWVEQARLKRDAERAVAANAEAEGVADATN
ncbi:hypothetical protein H9Q73_005644 [Fusarium xylarioides]|nr:hypothetical protein H9Q73_005644 [Fusarium xylarioides]